MTINLTRGELTKQNQRTGQEKTKLLAFGVNDV